VIKILLAEDDSLPRSRGKDAGRCGSFENSHSLRAISSRVVEWQRFFGGINRW